MVKINENEVIISKAELYILIGAAAGVAVDSIDSRNLKGYDLEFMGFAAVIENLMEQHIWGSEKLPEQSMNILQEKMHEELKKEKDNLESYEGMRSICSLLLAAMQKTRKNQSITDLKYDPYLGTLAKFASGRSVLINTDGNSGMQMIRTIVLNL